MTEPLCVHGHPAWGCPDLRVEWDPLTVEAPERPDPARVEPFLPANRDATLILLAFLAIAVIGIVAWSQR